MRSPSTSPSIFDRDSDFVSGKSDSHEHVRVDFSQVNILRALSHTVAIYDPELHPNKKYSVRIQIDASVHTLEDSAALPANLVVFSTMSSNEIVGDKMETDQDNGYDMELVRGIACVDGLPKKQSINEGDHSIEEVRQDANCCYCSHFVAGPDEGMKEYKADMKLLENMMSPEEIFSNDFAWRQKIRNGPALLEEIPNYPTLGEEIPEEKIKNEEKEPEKPKTYCNHFDPSFYYPIRSYAHVTTEELMKKIFVEDDSDDTMSEAEPSTSQDGRTYGPNWKNSMKNEKENTQDVASTIDVFDMMTINRPESP